MRSSFYGFEIAKTGLFASQRAIDLTGHNIANANTVGYTRQRLLLSSKELVAGNERFKEIINGYSGAGVRMDGVDQIRNVFLDTQYRRENSTKEMWSARSDALSYIEDIYGETNNTGLSTAINDFFTSLHTLTMNPESKEYRTNVMQNAMKMTDAFQHIAQQLADKQADMNEAARVSVIQVNGLADAIAGLNDQIFRYELTGQRANDLRDQRNNLLDELSGIVNYTYQEDADGMVSVNLGGNLLVDRTTTHKLQTTATKTNPIDGLGNLLDVTWADYTEADGSASPLVVTGGRLKAYLDLRDGDTADNVGIPYMAHRLDTLASSIASEFNAIHNAGWTYPDASNGNASATGVDFFEVPAGGVTAFNFSISAAIKASVYNIAAAGSQIADATGRGDNTNALALVRLQNRLDLPVIGSLEGYLKGYLAEIGVEASHANKMLDSEQALVDSLVNQRESVSGVSVDEEMTNLVKFQHSYAASARVITTIDEYLDLLINKMGIVGR